jgi:hypothetical protein
MTIEKENKENYEKALNYLYYPEADENDKRRIKNFLDECVIKYGSVVEAYPFWHPLIRNQDSLTRTPDRSCGYERLDHNIYFENAFITCPYGFENAETVIRSVENLDEYPIADIKASRINTSKLKLYAENAFPVLITCEWNEKVSLKFKMTGSFDLISIPLILEKEMETWINAEVSESWDDMKPYYLGRPIVKDSSPFVSEETSKKIKELHKILCNSGMYGRPR